MPNPTPGLDKAQQEYDDEMPEDREELPREEDPDVLRDRERDLKEDRYRRWLEEDCEG